MEHLNKLFVGVALFGQGVCLDEKMCFTRVAYFMKQHVPNKPHKWDLELFVLRSLSEHAYNSFLRRFSIRFKSRTGIFRLLYHITDMVVINSWGLYKKKKAKG